MSLKFTLDGSFTASTPKRDFPKQLGYFIVEHLYRKLLLYCLLECSLLINRGTQSEHYNQSGHVM